MKSKISADLAKELETLRDYIKTEDEAYIHKNQEYILATLALLLSKMFRSTIERWRKTYNIPNINPGSTLNGHIEWAMKQGNGVPYEETDDKVYALCKACHVNPKIYGSFVIDYLYLGDVLPFRPENNNPFSFDPHFNAQEEFRYRSRIELDYGMPREDEYTEEPQKAYIRIFGNTSQKNLINFVKKNWKDIAMIKKNLKPYPHGKKFKKIKRDIQIYLLYLLDKKVDHIAEVIYDENIPEDVTSVVQEKLEKDYDLENNRVYEIIEDIENHIKNINE